jgi:hypothetical protein
MTRSSLPVLADDPLSPARQLQSSALLDKSVTLLSTTSVEWDRRLFFLIGKRSLFSHAKDFLETQLKRGDQTI